jgi:hypothetical protein
MKIQQFVKRLNKTDTQQASTKERFLKIPPDALPDKMFPNFDKKEIPFYDRISQKTINLKFVIAPVNQERRIALATYFQRDSILPGDEIIVERKERGADVEYFINLKVKKNIIVFQKKDNGFECLNWKRFQTILNQNSYELNIIKDGKPFDLVINELNQHREIKVDEGQKQGYEFRFYELLINGESIHSNYDNDALLELEIGDKNNYLKQQPNFIWRKYEFDLPDKIVDDEYIKKRKNTIKSILEEVVKKHGYELGSTIKGYVRFLSPKLKDIIPKTAGEKCNWVHKESFLFEFDYRMSYIALKFTISPGEENNRKIFSEIVKGLPNSKNARGSQWLAYYSDKIEVDFLSDKYNNEAELERIFVDLLERNKGQIQQFETEVIKQQNNFTKK